MVPQIGSTALGLGRLTKKGKLSHGFLSQLHSEEVFRGNVLSHAEII